MSGKNPQDRARDETQIDAVSLLLTVQTLLSNIQQSLGDAQSQLDEIGLKTDGGCKSNVTPRILDSQPPDSSPTKPRLHKSTVRRARAEGGDSGGVASTINDEKFPSREDILNSAAKYSRLKGTQPTKRFPPRKITRRHSVSMTQPPHATVDMDSNVGDPVRSQSMYDISAGNRPSQFPPRWVKTALRASETEAGERADTKVDSSQTSPDIRESWRTMWNRFRAVDEAQVKDYKEDIDTLLVFAGLFSAVITAFVIAYYVSLQPDSKDTSAFLLFQISSQLSSVLPLNSTALDANQLSIPSFPFQLPTSIIRINTLWITSLLLALITASLGILVKQWLREYMAIDDMKPGERCRVRHLRFVHLHRWRVFQIASLLPLLLQLAVILFFLGLSEFARTLNNTVGWTVTAIVSAYLAAFISITFAPVIWEFCPYKTPFLKAPLQLPRYLWWSFLWMDEQDGRFTILKRLTLWLRSHWSVAPSHASYFYMREYGASGFEKRLRINRGMDIPIVVTAEGTFQDDALEQVYTRCLQDLDAFNWRESTLFSPLHSDTARIDTNDNLVGLLWSMMESAAYHSIATFLFQSDEFSTSSDYAAVSEHLLLDSTSLARFRAFPEDVPLDVMRLFAEDKLSSLSVLRYFARFADRLDVRTIPVSWCLPDGLINLVSNLINENHNFSPGSEALEHFRIVDFTLLMCRAIMSWDMLPPAEVVTLVRRFTTQMAEFMDEASDMKYYSNEEYTGTCLEYVFSLKDETPGMVDRRFITALQNLHSVNDKLE